MRDATRLQEFRDMINQTFIKSEPEVLADLESYLGNYDPQSIGAFSKDLITAVRAKHARQVPFDAFLHEYGLNSEEGIVLMSIAEALLRIPDVQTQNRFLQDKLADADWHSHLAHSDSLMVNFASGALLLGGKIEDRIRHVQQNRQRIFDGLLVRLGEPLIRAAIKQSIAIGSAFCDCRKYIGCHRTGRLQPGLSLGVILP